MAVKKKTVVRRPSSITLEEFTSATYDAVVRAQATHARAQGLTKRPPFGPIIFGLIWWPDGPEGRPNIGPIE